MEGGLDRAKQDVQQANEKLQGLVQRFFEGLVNVDDAEAERQRVCEEVDNIRWMCLLLDPNSQPSSVDADLQSQVRQMTEMSDMCVEAFQAARHAAQREKELEEKKKTEEEVKPSAPVILGNSQSSDNTITPIVLDEEVTSLGILQEAALAATGPSPIGLDNLMQWCHYNAIMQCLCHLPPIIHYCQIHAPRHHNDHCTDLPCSLCHLHAFIQHYTTQVNPASLSDATPGAETAPTALPSPVLSTNKSPLPALRTAHNALLCHLSARSAERLMIAEQQDCHETWQTLVHCCAVDYFRSCGVAGGNEVAGGKRMSPLQRVFTGALQSCLTCAECGQTSHTTETFSSLALQVHADDLHDLDTAVSRFIAEEGDVNYTCEACQQSSTASKKKLDFIQLPDALVIQLVRFRDQNNKISKHITFHEELQLPLLNIQKPQGQQESVHLTDPVAEEGASQQHEAAAPTHRSVRYKLCGVVEHLGQSLHFGHYRSFVRVTNNQHTSWFEANDNQIAPKNCFEEVASIDAYLLFYSKEVAEEKPAEEAARREQHQMDMDETIVPDGFPGKGRQMMDVQNTADERAMKKPRVSCEGCEGEVPPAASPDSPVQASDFDAMVVPDIGPAPTA